MIRANSLLLRYFGRPLKPLVSEPAAGHFLFTLHKRPYAEQRSCVRFLQRRRCRRLAAVFFVLLLFAARTATAYSFLTHEQLIDLTWKASIQPVLLGRFPKMTATQMNEAHAYAYGGCVIQDLGYYPFSNEFFSDLTHYVRSGDFVSSLLRNARTPDELAFAIGAYSHYIGDIQGHADVINPAVAIEFPKLEGRYGHSVAYDQDPHAHVRTEFAFDVNEISKHRSAPSAYLRHVGLQIPSDLLRRSFYETYGLDELQIIGRHHQVLRTYRFAVRSFLPRIAYAETLLHRNSMPDDRAGAPFEAFKAQLAQADFENGWDQYRKKAGIGTHMLAGVIWIVPKVGPLSDVAIKGPTEDTEERYIESVTRTTSMLRTQLSNLGTTQQAIPNRDLDTGAKIKPGSYRLTDETYAQLLKKLTSQGQKVPAGLKNDILAYYADPDAPISTKKKPVQWARVQRELVVLQGMPTTPEP